MALKFLATIDITKIHSRSLRFVSLRGRTYELLLFLYSHKLQKFLGSNKYLAVSLLGLWAFKTFSLVSGGLNLLVIMFIAMF